MAEEISVYTDNMSKENTESKEKKAVEEKKAQESNQGKKPSLEEVVYHQNKIQSIWDHCRNVRTAAEKLCMRLCEEGDFELARRLAERANKHDASKFTGIEYEYLGSDSSKDELRMAVKQHQATNDHHPEHYVNGIKDMSDEALAEWVCDVHARSSEFGTDLRKWIKEVAMDRFSFTYQSNAGRKIKRFVDLLLDPSFKKV